jgi:hypothetical protein
MSVDLHGRRCSPASGERPLNTGVIMHERRPADIRWFATATNPVARPRDFSPCSVALNGLQRCWSGACMVQGDRSQEVKPGRLRKGVSVLRINHGVTTHSAFAGVITGGLCRPTLKAGPSTEQLACR